MRGGQVEGDSLTDHVSEFMRDFDRQCFAVGQCPRCTNAGESKDHHLDVFGVCRTCGLDCRKAADDEAKREGA